jgi:hypothetical protein
VVDLAELLRSALVLDPRERAVLAERLLASLDELSEEEAERLWAEEAARRLGQYRAGRGRLIEARELAQRAAKLIS